MKSLLAVDCNWLQTIWSYLMNIKKIPRIDKINDAKSHIVKFSFRISKVKSIAQIVLDPDLAATAASGKINENALNISINCTYRGYSDGWWAWLTWERSSKQLNKIMKSKTLSIDIVVQYKIEFLSVFHRLALISLGTRICSTDILLLEYLLLSLPVSLKLIVKPRCLIKLTKLYL